MLLRSVVLLLAVRGGSANNGYHLSMKPSSIASTVSYTLDKTDTEIAKLANGFTLMEWVRFNDLGSKFPQMHFQIISKRSNNFIQPFAGTHGGWAFDKANPATVSTLTGSSTPADQWHHYTLTWDAVTGDRKHYVDGLEVAADTVSSSYDNTWLDGTEPPFVVIGMSCYNDKHYEVELTRCNPSFSMDGDIDDVALFAGAMSPTDVGSLWDQSLTNRINTGTVPNLVLFYNFNEPFTTGAPASETRIPNKGTAGANYDLRLGKLSKNPQASYFEGSYDDAGKENPFVVPLPAVSSLSTTWAVPRVLDDTAPCVVSTHATGTHTVDFVTQCGAPAGTSSFDYTAHLSGGGGTDIINSAVHGWSGGPDLHLVPELTPAVPPAGMLTLDALEDASVFLKIYGNTDTGVPLTTTITVLPTNGNLYEVEYHGSTDKSKKVTSAYTLTFSASWLLYVPNANQFGSPLDTFKYTVSSANENSAPTTVTISVEGDDDKPSVTSTAFSFVEDTVPKGILIKLNVSDVEVARPLAKMITTLPTKGKLYQTADGTLTGTRRLISSSYQIFDVGNAEGQYADKVISVSSFWGGPPYVGYHPINVLGPPDCKAYGECAQDGDWVYDMTVYPDVGLKLLHNSLLAYVTGHDKAGDKLMIEYAPMYKDNPNGDLTQCVIDPDGASKAYPDDCSFDLTTFDMSSDTPPRVRATVDRASVGHIDAGVWSPLYMSLALGAAMEDKSGAFGGEFVYNHLQDSHYNKVPKYTEFIEVSIKKPVFVVQVEIGSPRGMGHIVSVKVKDPKNNWIVLQENAALVDEQTNYARTKKYWQWAPDNCRSDFTASEFRIEVDTSGETGISDWNYIDYIQVYGAPDMQAAALPSGVDYVVYVPNEHAFGTDSFEYKGSDCPGNLFHFSDPGTVSFTIDPVNDAPTTMPVYVEANSDERISVPLLVADVDDTSLTVSITSLPDGATLMDSGANDVEVTSDDLPYTIANGAKSISLLAGGSSVNTTFGFSVQDPEGLSASNQVYVDIEAPPTDNTMTFIIIIAILGAVIIIVLAVVAYKAVKFIRAAVKGKKAHERAKKARVKKAVRSAVEMQSAAYLITYKDFMGMGRLRNHEYARDARLLKTIDDYDDLTTFVGQYPIVFFSHQWLSWADPDPDKLQYNEMLASIEAICSLKGFVPEDVYIFLDYLSIPQKNVAMRLAAINTLGVFASIAQYFVVVAPDSHHKDTKKVVDKASYQRRGWCRLEQWGHMCVSSMDEMFFYDGKQKKLIDLDDTPEDHGDWYQESIMVFEGEYTNPDNKPEMVDVVLGLYAMVIYRKSTISKDLYELISKCYSRVFPAELFEDLPILLAKMMKDDDELIKFMDVSSKKIEGLGGANSRWSSRNSRPSKGSTQVTPY